jgi:hypothetical protein
MVGIGEFVMDIGFILSRDLTKEDNHFRLAVWPCADPPRIRQGRLLEKLICLSDDERLVIGRRYDS